MSINVMKYHFKKIRIAILTGVILSVISFRLSYFAHFITSEIDKDYSNTCLLRSWSDPKMLWFFIHPFVTSVIMAFTWSFAKGNFKDKFNTESGARFGLLFWIISLPSLLLSYSIFPISLLLTITWAITGLSQAIVAGYIFSKTIQRG